MKKIISIFLAISLVSSASTTVMAGNLDDFPEVKNEIVTTPYLGVDTELSSEAIENAQDGQTVTLERKENQPIPLTILDKAGDNGVDLEITQTQGRRNIIELTDIQISKLTAVQAGIYNALLEKYYTIRNSYVTNSIDTTNDTEEALMELNEYINALLNNDTETLDRFSKKYNQTKPPQDDTKVPNLADSTLAVDVNVPLSGDTLAQIRTFIGGNNGEDQQGKPITREQMLKLMKVSLGNNSGPSSFALVKNGDSYSLLTFNAKVSTDLPGFTKDQKVKIVASHGDNYGLLNEGYVSNASANNIPVFLGQDTLIMKANV